MTLTPSEPTSDGGALPVPDLNFDALVNRLEVTLLPLVRQEESRLCASGKFTEVGIFSLRHAEAFHALGISGRPRWASQALDRFALCALLTGYGGLSGRIDVGWSQTFTLHTGSGYVKKETKGFHHKLNTEAALVRFEQEWARLFQLFSQVAERGTPSSALVRWWRGAPADLLGPAAALNQPIAPTPGDWPA